MINTKENIESWSKNSSDFGDEFFDSYKDEGDFWHKELINPHVLKFLQEHPGEKALDVGCGEGYFSRILARDKYQVTGVEPSDMINYAIKYENEEPLNIEYIKEDICDFDYRENDYDIIVSINVFMDIPDYKTALRRSVKCMKPGGRLVLSILHPCFTSIVKNKVNNTYEKKWDYEEKGHLIIEEYSNEMQLKQLNDVMIHRTLSTYTNSLIDLGLVIKGIVEPKLDLSYEEKMNKIVRDCHVPSFLIICADKPTSS